MAMLHSPVTTYIV